MQQITLFSALPHLESLRDKVLTAICDVDLIIEVVDARLPLSTSNLFDYSRDGLRDKPRLVLLTFHEMADNKILDLWLSYWNDQGVKVLPVKFIKERTVKKLTNFLQKHKIWSFLEKPKLKIGLVGVFKAGKKCFINRISEEKQPVAAKFLGMRTKKNNQYKIGHNITVVDTISILPSDFHERHRQVYNLLLLNKIDFYQISDAQLANSALIILWEHYKHLVHRHFLPNLDKRTLTMAIKKHDTLTFFPSVTRFV